MFLRCTTRKKNGKEHRYWSLVENRRLPRWPRGPASRPLSGGDQRCAGTGLAHLHRGVPGREPRPQTVALFPDDRGDAQTGCDDRAAAAGRAVAAPPAPVGCLLVGRSSSGRTSAWISSGLRASRPAARAHAGSGADGAHLLPPAGPGSEWRLHREWFDRSALPDLLNADFSLADSHKLYACHDCSCPHKAALFQHLTARWRICSTRPSTCLLYDLTSTYFESAPPFPEEDKRKFGHSRDKRADCVQVVIALIVTPEGFPAGL